MAVSRLSVLSVLALFCISDAYRVNSLSRDKVEARGKSRAKVNFHRVQSHEGAGSNSSIFIAAGLIGAFSGTLAVSAAAPGVVTAAAGASALVSNCAPSIGLVAPALAAGGAATPALMAVVPLALLAALALVGGLVALHVSSSAALAALAFCPVSNFAAEPMQALVSTSPYLAFPDELPEMMDDGLDGGMPACRNLKTTVLATTKCAPGDKECQEHACREKCCEDESCTFYQFSVDPLSSAPGSGESAAVVCELGEKHQLVDSNCEKPFFGEVCTNRLPFWKQVGKDHTKCLSGYGAGSGFLVDDQMDCQETAIANGHCYYQYNEEKKTCATCKDDSDMTENTMDNWKVFKDPSCGGSHVVSGALCNDWQLKKVLMHKMADTEEVRPVSRGCRGNSASCLKKRCRTECSKKADCTFYQFQENTNKCFLGTAEILDEDGLEKASYGGFVSSERKCKTGFQCPTTNECVDDCSSCQGFSQNGETTSGRGKKRNWCERTTVQSMCNDENWVTEYRGTSVGQWCEGMEVVTVIVEDELDVRETGENLCKQACCSNQDCAMYQMDASDAKKKGSDFKKGDQVKCQLGLETAGKKPLFKCAGVPPKSKRNKAEPVGMALSTRGCTGGSVACLTKRTCVDHCRTECMGAPVHNAEAGLCETETSAEEEHLNFFSDPHHKHAAKDNVVKATPKMHMKNTDDAYYLEESPQQADKYAEKDDLLGLQLNSKKVISSGTGDLSNSCDSLKERADENMLCYFMESGSAGACECEFSKPQQCSNWFESDKKLKYVVEDTGMLIFTGDRCDCSSASVDGMYKCTFGIAPEIPKLKADKGDEVAMTLTTKPPTCNTVNKCDEEMKLISPGAVGTVISFGTHNCGYTYSGSSGDYYCDSKCNCHQELDDDDVEQGKQLEDDSCSDDRVCPRMSSCSSLDYGSYGCGYSCENADGDFFFCSQDCDCESEE